MFSSVFYYNIEYLELFIMSTCTCGLNLSSHSSFCGTALSSSLSSVCRSKRINSLVQLFETFSDRPWNWCWLSMNPNITFDLVLKHPDKPWDWSRLSSNPNITFDLVLKHPDKPWDWSGLSSN